MIPEFRPRELFSFVQLAPGVQHRLRFAQALFIDPTGQMFLSGAQGMVLLDSAY